MGRISNNNSSIDDLKCISISTFSKNGYLKPNTTTKGLLEWSKNGDIISSISFEIIMYEDDGILKVYYSSDTTKNIAYSIPIVSKPSNLGKGLVHYFECIKTLRICRKLHLYNGYFNHISLHKGLIYTKQKYSKKEREIDFICKYILDDKIFDEVEKKHFKKFYKGIPTKKYQSFLNHCSFKEQNYSYLKNRFDYLFYNL